MTGPGTNTYLVGRNQAVIIDPGPSGYPSHLSNLFEAVQTLSLTVQAVVVTHLHSDHSGCAPEVAQQLKVPLLSFGQPLSHGFKLQVDNVELEVCHTPGHIYAHICLWPEARGLLFAGDLVAGQGTVLIIPPDGDMADYLHSLRAMQTLPLSAILPGHGPVIEEPQTLLQTYLDHRLAREQQVLHWLALGYTTAEAIAAQIYADRPEALRVATLQVEAHLGKLKKEGQL
jgi:glyoxylase-like metal-dependent hydrolase (beta-lactamase superfamily II)